MLKIITNYRKLFIKVLRNDFSFEWGNFYKKIESIGDSIGEIIKDTSFKISMILDKRNERFIDKSVGFAGTLRW